MSSTRVSVRDISRKTGYSPATVSNALNGKRGVSEETARAIRKVAADLGYRRSSKLRQVQFVIGRNSGRMIDEGSFRLAVVNGVEDEARLNGLTTSYATVELSEPETAQREIAALMNDTSSGIILLGTEMIQRDYDLFASPKVPLAIVDGVSDNHFFDSIVFTNEGSAHRAVNYLINRGHTKIGYIAGSLRIRNFPLRERGYARALTEAGLPFNLRWRVSLSTDSMQNAYHDMLAWLDTMPEMPTAFFAENDALAIGAMKALTVRGFDVPGDVSMVGFDDVEFASIAHPSLTTVHVPRADIGRMAVRKLIEQVEHPTPYTSVTHLSTMFIERESVRSL